MPRFLRSLRSLRSTVFVLALFMGMGLGFHGVPGSAAPPAPKHAVRTESALRGSLAYISGGDLWLQGDSSPAVLLVGGGGFTAVRWTPGGTGLLVVQDGTRRLFWPDGTPGPDVNGAWLPDDSGVAVAQEDGSIDLVSPRSGEATTLIAGQPGVVLRPVAWSPDGSRLALNRLSMDAAGNVGEESVLVTDGAGSPLSEIPPGDRTWPEAADWSPDSQFLAVWRGPALRCVSCRADGQQLDVVQVSTGSVRTIGPVLRPNWYCWSSPSTLVASVGWGRETYRNKRIISVELNMGVDTSVDESTAAVAIQPACAPQGGLAFTRGPALMGPPFSGLGTDGTIPNALPLGRRIWVATADGGTIGEMDSATGSAEESPTWTGTNRLLFVRWSGTLNQAAAHLWLRDTSTGSERELVDSLGTATAAAAYYGDFNWTCLFAWHP
jgi:hypothetical protein